MTSPHYLQSQHINPASLVELQVLSKVATEMQLQDNVKGSIPYLAKICQIVDNQQTDSKKAMDQIRAQAHVQLADAYFKSHQFVQCEASLSIAVKLWEKSRLDNQQHLASAYDQLKACYETLEKYKLDLSFVQECFQMMMKSRVRSFL
ncbi:hypothetical protein BDA99DRAFT_534639 [Phascolomyces articulosus]|uniref:Uncharacterized protein n=1 Tax=Phascolomyces articulosus TaxID=60185 RepID=A0AAD5PG99_9FUNG|nr:hypothetical protein BDA99DRAFT_534639 [Phascolomyces articulosus]